MGAGFYRSFEERYRGSVEEIKKRLSFYIPFVLTLKEIYPDCTIIDIGCGRGEWLEILNENGIKNIGVDLDDGMLARAKDIGLNVLKMDCLQFLEQQQDDSLAAITGFHIAEHLPFEVLQQLIKQAQRVLKPGGLLILETPNPENLNVGACSFYMDPTHNHPLPPLLLNFLPEYYNFKRSISVRLQEKEALRLGVAAVKLSDVLKEVSPDYSIIAQKDAESGLLEKFTPFFSQEYGVTLNTLCDRYDLNIEKQRERTEQAFVEMSKLSSSLHEINECLDVFARELEKNRELQQQILDLKNSRSWRMTKPYRYLGLQFHLLRQHGAKQRIKNLIKRCLISVAKMLQRNPGLKNVTRKILYKIGLYQVAFKIYGRLFPAPIHSENTAVFLDMRIDAQLNNSSLIPESVEKIYQMISKNN